MPYIFLFLMLNIFEASDNTSSNEVRCIQHISGMPVFECDGKTVTDWLDTSYVIYKDGFEITPMPFSYSYPDPNDENNHIEEIRYDYFVRKTGADSGYFYSRLTPKKTGWHSIDSVLHKRAVYTNDRNFYTTLLDGNNTTLAFYRSGGNRINQTIAHVDKAHTSIRYTIDMVFDDSFNDISFSICDAIDSSRNSKLTSIKVKMHPRCSKECNIDLGYSEFISEIKEVPITGHEKHLEILERFKKQQ